MTQLSLRVKLLKQLACFLLLLFLYTCMHTVLVFLANELNVNEVCECLTVNELDFLNISSYHLLTLANLLFLSTVTLKEGATKKKMGKKMERKIQLYLWTCLMIYCAFKERPFFFEEKRRSFCFHLPNHFFVFIFAYFFTISMYTSLSLGLIHLRVVN